MLSGGISLDMSLSICSDKIIVQQSLQNIFPEFNPFKQIKMDLGINLWWNKTFYIVAAWCR